MEKFRKDKFGWLGLFLAILVVSGMVFGPDALQAQMRGRIIGRVIDVSSRVYLPGANVMLEGTLLGASSDREGKFSIENVPPGNYTLAVSYMGYEKFSIAVTVVERGTVEQDVRLKISYVQGKEVVVEGLREGQVKALSQQRTSPTIENVIAEEQMQRFPDLNTAEVLQRIPGITVERDQGEGRYVHIRGTDARLSSISVNGERIASPEDGERFVGMDVISASQVASIEVVKAPTPDMDGDAIGGSVNLVTRSAFDTEKPILHVQTGGGYSNQLGKPLYQGVFTYGRKFGPDQKFGITVTGNYDHSQRSTWDNEMGWGEVETTEGGIIPFALEDLDLRDYLVTRKRWNVAGNLEFRPNANNQFFIRGMYNNRDDYEYRRRLYVRPSKGDFVDATHIEEAKIYRELKDRLERQNIMSFTAGGLNKLGNLNIDYTVAFSRGETEKMDETDPMFVMNEKPNLTLDLSNTDTPQYLITSEGPEYDQFNADNFKLDGVKWNNDITTDQDILGALNLKYSYNLGSLPSELKIGGKTHFRTKDKDYERWVYEWAGDDDLLMTQFVGDQNIFILDGIYRLGPAIDGDKFRDVFQAQKENPNGFEGAIDRQNSDAANYTANENIYAYYAMNTVNAGNWMILAGVRHEFTGVDNTSNDVLLDADGNYVSTTSVDAKHNYNNIMPMVHIKYRLTPMTSVRASVTTGIARPNYYDLVPYRIVLPEDEEIYEGNSTLKPTTAINLDFMYEHYFQGIGVISGGLFSKKLNNIIFTQTSRIDDGSDYDGYYYFHPVNGGNSKLQGAELNWQQQLTFLPGFLSGLGIYANYTRVISKADVGGRLERPELPGQAGNVANFAISYEKWGFSGRLSLNYHGKFLSEVGEDKEHDIFYKEHMQIDFSASQKIYKWMQVYLEAINLNKEPMIYYMGNESRPTQREFYSWWMHAGIKVNM